MGSEDETRKFDEPDPNRLPAAIADLERRLTDLERKFQERGYDTRPLFEAHHERIAALEKALADPRKSVSNPLTFEHNLYWAPNDQTPFCPNCFEAKLQEQRHLQPGNDIGKYWCTKCKNRYIDARHAKPDPEVSFRHPLAGEFD